MPKKRPTISKMASSRPVWVQIVTSIQEPTTIMLLTWGFLLECTRAYLVNCMKIAQMSRNQLQWAYDSYPRLYERAFQLKVSFTLWTKSPWKGRILQRDSQFPQLYRITPDTGPSAQVWTHEWNMACVTEKPVWRHRSDFENSKANKTDALNAILARWD